MHSASLQVRESRPVHGNSQTSLSHTELHRARGLSEKLVDTP